MTGVRRLSRCCVAAGVLIAALAGGTASAQPLAFVAGRGDAGTAVLNVINTATGRTTATFEIGSIADQTSVAALPDGSAVFVAIGSRLWRLQVATGVMEATDFSEPVDELVLSPDSRHVYVTKRLAAAVHVVDTATGGVIGSPIALPFVAGKIAISPNGERLYVLTPWSGSAGSLAVVDAASGTVVATFSTDPAPIEVRAHPDGTRVFVAHSTYETTAGTGDSLVAYDAASGTVLGRVTLPDNRASSDYWPGPITVYASSWAGRITIPAQGERIYVPRTSYSAQKGGSYYYREVVDIVDAASLTRLTTVTLQRTSSPWWSLWSGGIATAVAAGSNSVWAASVNGVWEIDAATNAVREAGPLANSLKDMAVAPAPPCWFEVGASPVSFRSEGGVAHLTVPAPSADCTWTATPSDGWISASPPSGSSAGPITVVVGPSAAPRSGTITIAGQPVAVVQRIMYANIDIPADGATVAGPFTLAGWALDHDGRATGAFGSGIGEIRVTDETPGQPVRLLATPYGHRRRTDVAAAYGARFADSGFSEQIPQLAAGRRVIVVRTKSEHDGAWLTTTREVTVPRLVLSAIDAPPLQDTSTPRFRLSGWALDRNTATGCGIAVVHVWAFPHAGGAPTFFGATGLGRERGDLVHVFGDGAFRCGWELFGPPLPAAGYRVVAYAFTVATGTVESESGVDVIIRHKPFGVVDTPVTGDRVAGAISITGWALDDVGVARVAVFLNDTEQLIADATFVEGARPDVATAYAAYPARTRAGWGVSVLTNMLPNRGNGDVIFRVIAYDAEGNQTLLERLHLHGINTTSTLPFGTIDAPAQGATVSGVIPIFGWALTPGPNIIPADGSTIDVIVDNVVIGHPVFGQCRGTNGTNFPAAGTCNDDIATAFGLGYRNLAETSGAVGSFLLDTTTLTNGIHSLVWRVTDSAGNLQGIGSRFIYVNNVGSKVQGFKGSRVQRFGTFEPLNP